MPVAKLKLAYSAPVAHRLPRPFQTYYFGSRKPNPGEWSRIGRASSGIGAIRAAIVQILRGHHETADIFGEDGVRLYKIRQERGQITISGYFKPLHDVE